MVKEGLGTCDKTLVTQRDGLCLRLRLFKQLVVEVFKEGRLFAALTRVEESLLYATRDDRLVFLTEITACFGGRSAGLGKHGIDLEGKLGIRAEAFDGNGIERIQIGIRIDCKVVSHAAVAT